VLSTLAQAMRCKVEALAESYGRICEILGERGWAAPELAIHLVEFVANGVVIFPDSPGDNLRVRLDRLPKTFVECACRACRGWRALEREREREQPRRRTPRQPVTTPPPRVKPTARTAPVWTGTASATSENVPREDVSRGDTAGHPGPVRSDQYRQVTPNLLAEIERAAAKAVEERLRQERDSGAA